MIHHATGSAGIMSNDKFTAYRKEFVGDFFLMDHFAWKKTGQTYDFLFKQHNIKLSQICFFFFPNGKLHMRNDKPYLDNSRKSSNFSKWDLWRLCLQELWRQAARFPLLNVLRAWNIALIATVIEINLYSRNITQIVILMSK